MPEKNNFKSSIRRASSMVYPSTNSPTTTRLCTSTSRPEDLSHIEEPNTISVDSSARSPAKCLETGDGVQLKTSRASVAAPSISPSLNSVNFILAPHLPFVIKCNPIDADKLKPLLVFLNPRSGGNQGLMLLRKFQWLLNPRQVFDLTQGGPRMGLELYNRVPNLRILACGGDGTVGWVFSTIDELKLNPAPPVAVLPLGTGNDLARTLRWGAGYADEPISKILRSIEQGTVVALDRWQVDCTLRSDITNGIEVDEDEGGRQRSVSSALPLKVFNNYFSLGADAATALEFHESREANPEKFNSRIKNKIFYAGFGGKDLLLRSWRDLCEHITLECDGKDLTPLIRSIRPHVILFLNIPRYGSGTLPWGQAPTTAGFEQPRIDDGLIEVIGLSSTTLAMLQVGGHGDRICQCRTVTLTTNKVIPMQMDGEPCRLMPSILNIHCSHQALVVQKLSSQSSSTTTESDRKLLVSSADQARLLIFVIPLEDYQAISDDALALRRVALFYGSVSVKFTADLKLVREIIHTFNSSIESHPTESVVKKSEQDCDQPAFHLSDSWNFIDSTTAASRFFRIEQEKEAAHFITDICNMEELFLIDADLRPQELSKDTDFGCDQVPNEKASDDTSPKHNSSTVDKKSGEDAEWKSKVPPKTEIQSDLSMQEDKRPEECDQTACEESINDLDMMDRNSESSPQWNEYQSRNKDEPTEQESSISNHHKLKTDSEKLSDLEPDTCVSKSETPLTVGNSDNNPSDQNDHTHVPLENAKVTEWLQINGLRRDSGSSSISQRTCEIELVLSDDEHRQGDEVRKRSHQTKQKHATKMNVLQARLDHALLNASRKGLVQEVEMLLEAGANIHAVDARGRSSLHLAAKFGREKTVQVLLRYASANYLELQEYEKKQTALHKAAAYRHHGICRLLLKAGACPTSRDLHGKRPGRLAHDANDFQLAYYLQHEELMFTIAHGRNKISV